MLLLIPKRLNELLERLGVDVMSLPSCNGEELEIALKDVPTLDKKVLYLINAKLNADNSQVMIEKHMGSDVDNLESMLASYLTNVNTVHMEQGASYKDIIALLESGNLVEERRDIIKKTTILIFDDGFLKNIINGKQLEFLVAVLILQVYNEVVCTGRTPVNLTQRLFKYI